jgi:hypothetical protein
MLSPMAPPLDAPYRSAPRPCATCSGAGLSPSDVLAVFAVVLTAALVDHWHRAVDLVATTLLGFPPIQ